MSETAEAPEQAEALENLERLAEQEPEETEHDPWIDQAEAEREADEAEQAKQAAAQQGAAMAVSFAETLVTMRYPYVAVDPDTKQAVEGKTAAVLYKHGGGLPPWLEPYREEIELGMVLAVAGFGIWGQVAAHEAAEQEQANAAAEAGEGAAYADPAH